MKKVLACLLVLLMSLSFFGCSTSESKTAASPSTASPSESTGSSPSAAAASTGSTAGTVELGFYDAGKNYSANKTYKVVYMTSTTGILYQAMSDAFAAWSERINVDYSYFAANGENDLYLNTLETYAAQGIDGFMFDPDVTIYDRIIDICNENNLKWISCMGAPKDESGKFMHPNVGFDNKQFGADMANWLIEYGTKTWTDMSADNVGMISIDYSVVPQIHDRTIGAQEVWNEKYPGKDANFIVNDGVSGKMDTDTAYNMVSATMAAHPEIKYWLVAAALDDYADGAARAAEAASKEAQAVVITCGGQSLIEQWDNGYNGCWKAAIFAGTILYAEPMINGLYAMMEGTATPETLWPEWIDRANGQKYASVIIPSTTLTKENYTEFLEWQDAYSGINLSDYDYKGTQFSPRGTPPASFAG